MGQENSEDRNDVLPLRLDEEIEKDKEDSHEVIARKFKENSRAGMRSKGSASDLYIIYRSVDSDIGWNDVLKSLDGISSKVLEIEYDKDGKKSRNSVGDESVDFSKYMERFFLPEEVFEVKEVEYSANGIPAWEEIYWVGGYSGEIEEKQRFGPFDSFEGPPLKYAMIGINDEYSLSLFDYSAIESKIYHPQAKLDQYTEDGKFPQEVLKEGLDFNPEDI